MAADGAMQRARGGWSAAVVLLGALLSLWLAPPRALAHPDLDEGLRLAEDLELEAALLAFDAALSSGELTRDEVVRALTEKALLLHALRNQGALIETFTWLAAIEPDHLLGVRAPPDLVAQWTSVRDQARGRLAVRIEQEVVPGHMHVRIALSGVRPEALSKRLSLRLEGADWEAVESGVVDRAFPEGAEVELYARVLGLGGLELAHHGTPEQPVRLHVPALAAEEPAMGVGLAGAADAHDNGRDDERRRNWWITTGAVLVAVAAVTGAVVAIRDSGPPSTDLMPKVDW